MILTDITTGQPLYIKPEAIVMAVALVTPPQPAVEAKMAAPEIGTPGEPGYVPATAAVEAQEAMPGQIFPGAKVIISGMPQGQTMLIVKESPTEISNEIISILNNRRK